MKKSTKIWLIIAAFLVLVGGILFTAVMAMLEWDFAALSTARYETNTYEVGEAFDGILIDTDSADILFALSDDGKCRVECREEENAKHSVAVEEGTLTVRLHDEKNGNFELNFGSSGITVYLPKAEYASLFIDESSGDIEIPKDFHFDSVAVASSTGDVHFNASASGPVQIKTDTGDIRVESISAGGLDLSVSTGNVTASDVDCREDVTVSVSTGDANLTDIACKSVISTGNTGDISLQHVIAEEQFSITRSTGDVRFEDSDAAAVFVETDTGYVTGNLLTDKVFLVQTDTGSVDVPKAIAGGRCEITTDTGDIIITVG